MTQGLSIPRIVRRASSTLASLTALACIAALSTVPGCRREDEKEPTEQAGPAQAAAPISDESSALSPSGRPYSETRKACANRDPHRQAFFGELHVHSTLSMDAWLTDVRNGPDETYRFGKGE